MPTDNLSFWEARTNRHAKQYWESRGQPYRGLLADALRRVAPFTSVLEIGCHAGPNLWALRQRWPDVTLIGVDPSHDAVMYGAAMFELEREAAPDFYHGHAPDCLDDLPATDIVVTCYTLAYLHPKDLDLAFAKITASPCRGLVLAEPMIALNTPHSRPGDSQPMPAPTAPVTAYRHDYEGRLVQLGWRVDRRPFPGPDGLDAIVTAVRA